MGEINILTTEVVTRKKEFITDSYSMSIGEIINLYKENEIIINPDYQRFFRWTISQKSKFIESILLDIPIPSIFVYQDEDGKWEVVDGLQRISTILEFVGVLKEKNKGSKLLPISKLIGTDLLPHLEGITWAKLPREPLQLNFKRTKLKIEIIKHESDPQAKFEVFQRLNSGGSLLTPQEFRNCILIMLNKEFFVWLEKLAEDKHFQSCLALTDKLLNEKYDMELVLRYLLFPTYKFSQKEISEYLTESSYDLAKKSLEGKFNYKQKEQLFRSTFKLLDELYDEKVFKKYSDGQFRGKFLESLFEAISIGVAENIDDYNTDDAKKILQRKIINIWQQKEFTQNMGSGTNTKVRVPKIIPFGIRYFKNV